MTSPAKVELRKLLPIALPLVAAYLAEYAMFVTTKLVVGSLGFKHLAAVGLSGSMTFELMVIMMGVISITGVLAAQAEGAGDKATAGIAARQGVVVAIILSIPLMAVIWNIGDIFLLLGQDPEIAALAEPYARALSPIAPAALIFAALRDFVAALARTRSIMFITLAAVGLNWGLAEGLVHGRWGLPEMGLPGAGIATAVVNWFMLILLVVYIYRTEALRGYGLFKSRLNVDFKVVAEFFRLGVPIAGLVAVEAGLFMAVGLLSGVIGTTTLAAHQVLMGWIGIPFVIALAMAEASMVRVAFQIGRGDPKGARLAGTVGIALGASVLTVLIAAPLLMAEQFTQLFISADDPGFADVSAIVIQLMMIAAIFQVFDGIQVIAARSLRGVKDTLAPLWIGAFGYWVMGIGVGWVLAFPMGYDGAGLWAGLALGIVTTACLLTWRFRSITGRLVDRCNLG